MMKYPKIMLLTLLASLTAMLSCAGNNGDEPTPPQANITINPSEIVASNLKTTATLTVSCDKDWTAYGEQDWIKCKKERDGKTVTVTIDENTEETAREGKVTVKSGTTLAYAAVKQDGRAPEATDDSMPIPEGYKLVWHDEFDEGSEPNTNFWSYETGGGGWGNHEIQEYVKARTPKGTQLASVKDGIFTISCVKEDNKVYSIRINTIKAWTYGYFEARLRLPKGKGTWPAYWMMPKNFKTWPGDGEIDIMEEVGYHPNYVSSSIHCNAYNHSIGTQKTKEKYLAGAQDDFHVYALEWTKDYIRTFVDGKELFRFDNDGRGNYDTWPFFNPFYLKFNLAWGGDWGGAQGIDESCLPATYQIDYVRVFQKK